MNVALFEMHVFADVSKDLEMSSSWPSRVGQDPRTRACVRVRERGMGAVKEKVV